MKNVGTKTGRRKFLKAVAMTPLCGLSLPAKICKADDENGLDGLIAGLEESEKQALRGLLQKLEEKGYMFTPYLASGALFFLDQAIKTKPLREQQEKALREDRRHLNSLSGQQKADYLVEKLKKEVSLYSPPYQQKMLNRVAEGESSEPDWEITRKHEVYFIGKINQLFEGCSKSLRQRVIAQYLRDALPPLEAEWEKEQAERDAVDEFVAMTNGKATEQIQAMTQQLKKWLRPEIEV